MSKDEPVALIAVAKAAGVSKTTASDALRDSGRVSERTKQHVVAVARRLGCTPNLAARSLRRAGTGVIGLHLPEILTRSEYYMSFVFDVVDQAATNRRASCCPSTSLPPLHRRRGQAAGPGRVRHARGPGAARAELHRRRTAAAGRAPRVGGRDGRALRRPRPIRFWQNYFDTGGYQLGKLSNSLELCCVCLGEITYLDAIVADDEGKPVTLADAICIHFDVPAPGGAHCHSHGG